MAEDEPIQNEVADDQVTDDQTVVDDSSQQQIQEDPYVIPENLRSRYKSAEELANFAAAKQSEADKLKREVEFYRQQHPETTQVNQPSNEEVLDRLVKDPVGFVKELTNDIRAQVALSEFARTHPKLDAYKEDIASIVNRTPAILADPDGLEMVYNLVERRNEANRLNTASNIKAQHNAQTQQLKKTDAVVETSSTAQRGTSPILKPGMTVEEMDKALDAAGIGWISDEERHKFEE